MNKLYSILILTLCFFVAGCSDDDMDKTVDTTLKVIRADVDYTYEGGTGEIQVSALEAFTATSGEAWCKVAVSGDKVTVTVDKNTSLSSRTSLVTLTSGSEKAEVRITQLGDVFGCDMNGDYSFSLMGGKQEFVLHTSREYTITATGAEGWLTYEVTDGYITVTALPTTPSVSSRVGVITIKSGKNVWKGNFTQIGLAGAYKMTHTRNDGKTYDGECVFTAGQEAGVYNLKCTGVPLGNGVPFKAVYADGKLTIDFDNQYLGSISANYIYLCAYDKRGFLAWGADIKYVAELKIDKNNVPYFQFGDVGSWEDASVDGFYYAVFSNFMDKGGQFTGQNYGFATDITMYHK